MPFTTRKTPLIAALLLGLLSAGAYPAAPDKVAQVENASCRQDEQRVDRSPTLRLQRLQTEHGTLAYYRFGQGSPILLITGYRAPLSEWNSHFLSELARRHEVIVFDNRGVGMSSAASDQPYRIETLAADAGRLITQLQLHDVTVAGWSMGGMVAQQLALNHPKQLTRLVLISSAPPGPGSVPIPAGLMPVLRGQVPDGFNRAMQALFPAAAVTQAARCFVGDMFTPHDYAPAAMNETIAAEQERLMSRWLQSVHKQQQLQRLRLPTLIVSGSEDSILPGGNSQTLHRLLARSTLSEFAGGHALMYQYPQQLAERIDHFIADAAAYR